MRRTDIFILILSCLEHNHILFNVHLDLLYSILLLLLSLRFTSQVYSISVRALVSDASLIELKVDQSARSVRCFISHKIAKIINHSTLESLSPHQMRLPRLPLPFMSQHKKLHPPDNCVPVPSLGPALRSCALPATVGNRQWKIAYIGARCRTERTLCICRARSSIHDPSLSLFLSPLRTLRIN